MREQTLTDHAQIGTGLCPPPPKNIRNSAIRGESHRIHSSDLRAEFASLRRQIARGVRFTA